MTSATGDAHPSHILVVDDEQNIRSGLAALLTKDGHQVTEAGDGEAALDLLETMACEVAIVDIRMPGMSGLELLHAIRSRWPHVAVILLTGQGTLESAIDAVRAGAQDYLLKPASPETIRETLDRALVASRRQREQTRLLDSLRLGLQRLEMLPSPAVKTSDQPGEQPAIKIGDLHIDLRAHEVCRDGEQIPLTPSEYNLLVALARRAGQVVDYVTLVRLSLDYQAEPWEAKELIKRHVFALRQKIEPDPTTPIYILNVRGVGYRLSHNR
jgi:DNA-binding response OmpR family regulator